MPASTTRRTKRAANSKKTTFKRSRYVTTDASHELSRYSMVPYRIVNGKLELLTFLMFNKSTNTSEISFSLGLPGIGVLQKDLYTAKASNDYIGEISHKFPRFDVDTSSTFSIAITLNAFSESRNLYTFVELPDTFVKQRNPEKPGLDVKTVDQVIGYMNNYLVNKYKNSATFYQYVFIDPIKLDLMFSNSQVDPDANVLKADLKTLVHAMKAIQEFNYESLKDSTNVLRSITINYDTITLNKFITGNSADIVKFTDFANARISPIFSGITYETKDVSVKHLLEMLKYLSVLTKKGINLSTVSSKLTEKVLDRLFRAAENYPTVNKLFKDAYMNYKFRIEAENPFLFIYKSYIHTIPEPVKRKLNPRAAEFVPRKVLIQGANGAFYPSTEAAAVAGEYNSTGAWFPTSEAAVASDARRHATMVPAAAGEYNSTGAWFPTSEAAAASDARRYGTY